MEGMHWRKAFSNSVNDIGRTHNFINPRMARKARLQVEKRGSFEVMVANGKNLQVKVTVFKYHSPYKVGQ